MTVENKQHFSTEQIFGILKRINYPLADPNVLPEPTLKTLQELQCRCVTSIPFETLSLRTTKTREVDLSLEGIYDRVVSKHRGGWCFSLNRLAFELLQGIGFKVQLTLARVCKPKQYGDPIVYGNFSHRISIVRFEDGTKYAFDIGFGKTSFYPIQLTEGATVDYLGHKRRLIKVIHNLSEPEILGNPAQEMWRLEEYLGEDKWIPCYAFTEQQFYDVDCDVGNFNACFSPKSVFLKVFWCIQATLDGTFYLLLGNELKVQTATGTTKTTVFEKEQDRLDALEKYFGITLTEEEMRYHDQKIE
ncbi:N-terminal acetyltransferase [Mortierella sp. AD011]|nr:N-terminal acetyltransferase [Mortierella sp. AD010]KAF9401492.1 N-terminal acetyltransferase [Mortierella sp. AD011]